MFRDCECKSTVARVDSQDNQYDNNDKNTSLFIEAMSERQANQWAPSAPMNSPRPWRAGWGGVAPGFPLNPAQPAPDSGKPWRAGWGDVAPGFPLNPPQPTPDSGKPWRAGWGDVAPGFHINPPQPAPDNSSPWHSGSADSTHPGWQNPAAAFRSDNVADLKGPGDFFPGFPAGQTDNTNGSTRPGDSSMSRPGSNGSTRTDAINAFNQDQVSRSEYSFDNAVDQFKSLGKESEIALESLMRDWLNQQSSTHPLTFMRGAAIIADGLGQFRLEEGSRIDLKSHQDTKPRILKGYDYDFGGEATTFLRFAAGSLVEGQQYVLGHRGLVIDGQPMDDTYINQLRNLQTEVESKLNVVYGAHDMNNIYNVLRNEVHVHSGDWQHGLVRLQHQLDALRTPDNRYVAKSARDVALGFLAEADYMSSQNNGEEAKIMYQAANKYIGLSMRNDSNAPDNLALQDISTKLAPQINKAIDNQWNDPFGNPFNIPKPTNSHV